MKNILRTKLEYNCNKTQEFNYGLCDWYTKYDRSFDMYVSASTKEECEKAMESFEDVIRAEGIQDCFDSNLAPEFDEKKKLWVGAVEVYVGNDYVADEKEAIMDVYREWKEQLKNAPAPESKEETVEETSTPAEKNNSEFLISEIKNLSSGTILSIAREAGFLNSNTVTWLEIEALEHEWIEFVEKIKDTSENWKQSWKKFAKYKDDMFEAWLNDEEFELEAWLISEGLKSEEPASIGCKPQEKRVEEMIENLELEKEYKVDDNAGTKMVVVKNNNGVWWGTAGLWNSFSSFKLDYQEYILTLIREKRKEGSNMKKIGGAIYIHRSNIDTLNQEQLELVWERLEQLAKTDYPCNSYEVIKIKGGTVSFIECEGWDELREPIVGNAYNVKPDGSVKLTKKREKNPQIYHHKWMFVADDYDGFDVEKEKEWSKKWQSVVPKGLSSSLGSIDNWKKFLREYGLEN